MSFRRICAFNFGFSFLILTGCSTTSKVVDVPIIEYPSLAPIPAIAPPQFYPVQFELPKDASGNVESVSDCVDSASSTQAATKCATGSTNVFIGLNQQSFVNLIINLNEMRAYATSCHIRMDQINAERAEWNADNAKNNTTTKPNK